MTFKNQSEIENAKTVFYRLHRLLGRVANKRFGMGQQTVSVGTDDTVAKEAGLWKAIDERETPQWWKDAKFGIFIHWGPYSVPAFPKAGASSEWYWEDLANPGRKAKHKEVKAGKGASVSMLGGGELKWEQAGDDLVIAMPKVNPSRMPCEFAWTFKVSSIVE